MFLFSLFYALITESYLRKSKKFTSKYQTALYLKTFLILMISLKIK